MVQITEWNEGADIEVDADIWVEQQAVLKALAEEAALDAMADMAEESLFEGIDSCLALQMIDGIVPIPEAFMDDLDREEQRIIDRAKAVGVPL